MRKIIVTVAPVCHVGKEIPAECKNPLTPEEIAEDTINCYKAGACEVHLHTRDLQGNPTFELDVFRQTIALIRQETDMIVQGSTGGLSTLTLAERCVSLDVPEVEVASLNMGSVNFGETVYINTMPDLRYWAKRLDETNTVPEMELFDLSHVECATRLADEGVLHRPLHYNFCVGPGNSSNLSATGRNLAMLCSLMEPPRLDERLFYAGMRNWHGSLSRSCRLRGQLLLRTRQTCTYQCRISRKVGCTDSYDGV